MSKPIDGPVEPKRGIPEVQPQMPKGQEKVGGEEGTRSFPPLMEKKQVESGEKMPSPMELSATQATRAQQVTPQTLAEQANQLNENTNELKKETTQPRLDKLDSEGRQFLGNQFSTYRGSLQKASKETNTSFELSDPPKTPKGVKEVLNWITQSQQQLQNVGNQLNAKTTGAISPESMLKAQAQLMAANNAISFATACISKGLEGVRQLMQQQL